MGVGSVQRLTAVHWEVATKIIWAWVLTIPASALLSSVCFLLLRHFLPSA
jgi:PiT family inorganic phosphate transporter